MAIAFDKFEQMKQSGSTAHEVYLAGKADGIDEIDLIRILRKTFGLSLGEAKQVTGALDSWTKPQDVRPGSTVYWERRSIEEGLYLMQARVVEVDGENVLLAELKKYHLVDGSILEVAPAPQGCVLSVPQKYLLKSPCERLAESLEHWSDVTKGHAYSKRAV